MAKRRGQGEGSIAKRPNGTWYARYTVKLPDGTKQRRCIYGKTRREVSGEMTRRLHDASKGLVALDDKRPLREYLTHWLETTAKPSVRGNTFRNYEGTVRLHISPELGDTPLASLTPQQVQGFLAGMVKSGLSERTALYAYTILKRALSQAVRWNLIVRNVCDFVDPPRAARNEMKVFSREQAQAFLQHVQGDRLEAYYTVAMSIGLRLGEALGLRWLDVDWARSTLTVQHSLQRLDGRLQLLEAKTPMSNRAIKMPTLIVKALRAHLARQDEERLAAGPRWKESGHVFTNALGGPVEPRNMIRQYKGHLAAAGLPDMRVHDMRHTAASLMFAQGIPLKMISEILGHSSSRVTLDIYAHIYDEGRQQAADQIDEIFSAKGVSKE